MVTLSVPTLPDAVEESPYAIFQVEPLVALKVEDFFGLKIVCPVPWLCVELGSSVDQTCGRNQHCKAGSEGPWGLCLPRDQRTQYRSPA
jgi:hypothetical protein